MDDPLRISEILTEAVFVYLSDTWEHFFVMVFNLIQLQSVLVSHSAQVRGNPKGVLLVAHLGRFNHVYGLKHLN